MTAPPEVAWTDDDAQRLASLKRCVPHMVGRVHGDVGGIWPRDVEWLIASLDRLRADNEQLKSDANRLASLFAGRGRELDALRSELAATRERETPQVHNHGPEEGEGLACRESVIDGRLMGRCLHVYSCECSQCRAKMRHPRSRVSDNG